MAFLLHLGAQVSCSHAGQAVPTSTSVRVKIAGKPATTLAHTYTITACTFTTPEPAPKPCTTVQWNTSALRVKIEGTPALLSSSSGVTIGPLGTQGTSSIATSQTRVSGQ